MKMQLFKKENNFKKKDFILNPNFYWKIAVFGAFILILLSAFFGYNLFTRTNQEPILPALSGSGQDLTVNKDHLNKVLNYFSAREQKSAEILNSPSPFVDPSL